MRRCRVEVRHEPLSLVIDIIDQGPGMTPEFIRDELFRPFATTKGGGHGIGAYQARELLREAGGDLLVLSRLGCRHDDAAAAARGAAARPEAVPMTA